MTWAFEELRSLIRRDWSTGQALAVEVAECLDAFDGDPAALVMAARRILVQRPAESTLWWTCTRVLCAADPGLEIRAVIDALLGDSTAERVAEALPFPSDEVVAFVGWSDVLPALHVQRPDVELVVVRTATERSVASRVREHGLDVRIVDPVDAGALGVTRVLLEPTVVSPEVTLVPSGVLDSTALIDAPQWLVCPLGIVLPDALARSVHTQLERHDRAADTSFDPTPPYELLDLTRIDRAIGPQGVGPISTVARQPQCPVAAELLRLA